MLELMGFMDAPSLGLLASVSRALYVFAHVEELWKGLVVQVYIYFYACLACVSASHLCTSVVLLPCRYRFEGKDHVGAATLSGAKLVPM